MVKIREMQAGTFVGKPKPDREIQEMSKKYRLDDSAAQRLAEVMAKRDNRKEDLEKLDKHLRVSNKPSALVMMMLGKLRKGEDIGEPEFKPAPGSYRWEKDVRKDYDIGGKGSGDRDRDERDDRGRGGGSYRGGGGGGDRDRWRDRDGGGGGRSRERDRERGGN